jgi:lipopolysaccharide transport protein LptA
VTGARIHGFLASVSIGVSMSGICFVAAAQPPASRAAFDAETLALDSKSNLFRLTKPRIRQGEIRIEADEALATSVDVEAGGKWELTGQVHIELDGVVLDGDSTVFAFANGQLSRFELTGSPASVEDRSSTRRRPVRGSAATLQYDHVERRLQMSGDAVLIRGQSTIHSCSMAYDFDDESFQSVETPACPDPRMRITTQRADGQ